jgi:hypothetical protein
MSQHVQLLHWVKSENLSALFRDEAQVFDGALLDADDLDSKRRKFDDLAFMWDSPQSIDDKSRRRLIVSPNRCREEQSLDNIVKPAGHPARHQLAIHVTNFAHGHRLWLSAAGEGKV